MPPESDGCGERTVCCSCDKAIPDAQVLADLQVVVSRAHLAGILASELLNIHVRLRLEADGACPAGVFDKPESRGEGDDDAAMSTMSRGVNPSACGGRASKHWRHLKT